MSSNVLLVIPWEFRKRGGVNIVVQNLALNLNKLSNRRVFVLENNWSLKRGTSKIENRCELLSYPLREHLIPSNFVEALKLPIVAFDLLKLALMIQFKNIKVVNFHYASNYISYFVFLRKCGLVKQLVLSLHGTDLDFIKKLSKEQRDEFIANIDSICLCSKFLKNEFIKICPDFEKQVEVIENGVDTKLLYETEKAECKPSKYILSVGSFAPVKGFDILIEAYRQLIEQDLLSIDLVLVGKSTVYLDELKSRCNQLGIASRVHFVRDLPHSCLADYYRNAELYVSSSRFESFGLTLLEAGLFSLPVVATKTGGALEILEANKSAILVTIDSQLELHEAIKFLLKNETAKKDLGKNLNKLAMAKFCWKRTAIKYDQIYRH